MIPLRYLFLGLSLAITAQAGQMIAYNKGAIYAAQLDGNKVRKLGPGSWPAISPDGTQVADELASSAFEGAAACPERAISAERV